MSSSRGLEVIELNVDGEDVPCREIPFEAFVGRTTWPRLRRFCYDSRNCVNFGGLTLLDFLERHRTTLKDIVLSVVGMLVAPSQR